MTRLLLLVIGIGLAPLTLELDIARFDGGSVTVADLVREGVFTSPSERRYRQHVGIPVERTLDDWSQRIALRELARQWAVAAAVDREPPVRERIRAAQRNLVVSEWARRGFDRLPPLSDEATMLAEARRVAPRPPDRMLLWHVYQRADSPEASAAARDRLTSWKTGVHSRTDLEALARRVSDSQSRRRGGSLGWCRRGFLPTDVEEVLFAAPPGSLVGPLEARQGWHLFWVERVETDREPRLDLVLARLRREAAGRAAAEARERALADARQRFKVEIGAGLWPSVRVGAWSTTGGVLSTLAPPGADPGRAVTEVVEGELLFALAIAEGVVDPLQRERLDDVAGQVLHEERLRRGIGGAVTEPTEAELRALFSVERERLVAPETLTVEAVREPITRDRDPLARFEEMADIVDAVNAGGLEWAGLVAALDEPETFAPGPAPALQLANLLGPPVLEALLSVAPGTTVGPVQDAGFLWLAVLRERHQRRTLGFEEARPALREAMYDRQARELGRELGDRALADAGFEYTRLLAGWLGHDER